MTKLLKVSLFALALVGASAQAETENFIAPGVDQAAVDEGLSLQAPAIDGIESALRPHRPGHPGRPDWRPGHPDRGHRVYRCTARDFHGRRYIARGFGNVNRVAREALRSCRYNSRFPQTCRVMGCR
jgi:hypothetical protein